MKVEGKINVEKFQDDVIWPLPDLNPIKNLCRNFKNAVESRSKMNEKICMIKMCR